MASSGFRGIFIEIIGDAKSYIRAAEQAIGMNNRLTQSNTLIAKSYAETGVSSQESAKLTVAASIKSTNAIKAQALALRELAATSTGATSERAALLAANAESKYARALGGTTVATRGLSTASKTGERDLNKLVRGGLAGSGAFSALGRSLAFASSGFIAFAAGATLITKSISAARALAVAQRQVNRQLEVSGKTFAQYQTQIDATTTRLEHLAGFTHVDLLSSLTFAVRATGNVGNSLKLLGIAADVARGRGISLQSAMIALTKAVGGSSTALRRLGIIVPKTAKGWDAINFVAAKFAGQAAAGATVTEKFSAVLNHTEEIIGQALLPTVNKLLTSLGNWLQKMNETGRLQKDVNTVIHDAATFFHDLAGVIKEVDKVTGSFKNTLELLIGLKFGFIVARWATGLTGLIGSAGAAGAGGEGLVGAEAAAGGLAARLTTLSELGPIAIPVALLLSDSKARSGVARQISDLTKPTAGSIFDFLKAGAENAAHIAQRLGISPPSTIARNRDAGTQAAIRAAGPIPAAGTESPNRIVGITAPRTRKILSQYFKSFSLSFNVLRAQAEAALTKSTTDDVRIARRIVADIKQKIARGQLHGQALLQALSLEASAISTIQSAETAAAQKRAAAAQAAAAKIQAQIQDSIDPLRLEVALSRAQALHKPILAILRKLRHAAQAALASGKLSLDQQKQAWDQITSLNQQIADELKKHKKKTQDAASAFKQASTRALTAGLGLSDAQRKALRERLSRLGPGGTIPGEGTGAFGQIIGDNGRPIHVHTDISIDGKKVAQSTTRHQQRHRRRNPPQRRGPHAGFAGG